MPDRRRLPAERKSITHHFRIGDRKGYLIIGLYEDGRPGELFIRMGGVGSLEHGLFNAVGILASIALQAGVPIENITDKFVGTRFEPDGWSMIDGEKHFATSVLDHICRYLKKRFGPAAAEERA